LGRTLISAEQYFELADQLPRHTQLIDGEIVVSEPTRLHQEVLGRIYRRLADWVDGAPGRGEAGIPVNVVLDDHNVFAPDVWWASEEHRQPIEEPNLVGPPDLAVEVRSPSTWRYDLMVKRATYERLGLAELWLVDTPARRALVFRRSSPEAPGFDVYLEVGESETLTSPLLPGFTLDLTGLFPG
jgi:Uma2 family endonuclease